MGVGGGGWEGPVLALIAAIKKSLPTSYKVSDNTPSPYSSGRSEVKMSLTC